MLPQIPYPIPTPAPIPTPKSKVVAKKTHRNFDDDESGSCEFWGELNMSIDIIIFIVFYFLQTRFGGTIYFQSNDWLSPIWFIFRQRIFFNINSRHFFRKNLTGSNLDLQKKRSQNSVNCYLTKIKLFGTLINFNIFRINSRPSCSALEPVSYPGYDICYSEFSIFKNFRREFFEILKHKIFSGRYERHFRTHAYINRKIFMGNEFDL